MFRLKVSVSEKASLFYLRMCIFVRQHLFFVWLRMRMIRESALFRLWEWNKIADCPCENAGSRETSLSLRMHLFETTWHHLQRMLRTVGEPFCLISFIWDLMNGIWMHGSYCFIPSCARFCWKSFVQIYLLKLRILFYVPGYFRFSLD